MRIVVLQFDRYLLAELVAPFLSVGVDLRYLRVKVDVLNNYF